MQSFTDPLLDFHHPMTFRSRGVAMPFTTPLLAGTCVRDCKREGVELVVPSPSGGRGVYILHWSGVRALCNPTVHDTLLFRRSSRLTVIDPASIRDTALEVAREGHAGRAASTAAEAALVHDRSQRALTYVLLLKGLVEQFDPNSPNIATLPERTPDLDRRAAAVLHRIAPSLGRPAAQLETSLGAIADMFAPIGVASTNRDARIPRLLIRLKEAHVGMARWLDADPGNDIGGLGQSVAVAMQRTCESGAAVLQTTRSGLMDTLALLKLWMKDPDGLSTRAARCDWLLDGWERVSLLWLAARTRASQRAALLEMAPLVPVLPREVMEWTDTPIAPEAMQQACRVTSHEDVWRTGGSAFALIERNENLLAMRAWSGPAPTDWPDGSPGCGPTGFGPQGS
ncbi:MAG: hypothetical protein ABSC06_11595 [Rhodopila sp.]